MKDLKAACISIKSDVGSLNENLDRIKSRAAAAKQEGADLVLFPELSLTGYTTSAPENIAIDRQDPSIKTLSNLAQELGLIICFSFAEKCQDKCYITACVTDGESCHFYRKIHLGFAESKVFSAGEKIQTIETDKASLGISICVESHMAPLFEIYRKQGVEIMLLPYASGMSGDTCKANWRKVLPCRANDMGVYVLACNLLKESSGGGMCILDPKGNVLDEYYGKEEHMILCDLKNDLPRNHPDGDMRNISYYDRQRPDVYEKYRN
ncbi:MAG: hypothetical protein KBS83_03975 [Lachnospiraceae bacterium]|nr:hypothetical protein [Candidatus Equihabitans merdae]